MSAPARRPPFGCCRLLLKPSAAVDGGSDLSGTHQQYFLTIDVPLPKPIELSAAAVETGERIEAEQEAAA